MKVRVPQSTTPHSHFIYMIARGLSCVVELWLWLCLLNTRVHTHEGKHEHRVCDIHGVFQRACAGIWQRSPHRAGFKTLVEVIKHPPNPECDRLRDLSINAIRSPISSNNFEPQFSKLLPIFHHNFNAVKVTLCRPQLEATGGSASHWLQHSVMVAAACPSVFTTFGRLLHQSQSVFRHYTAPSGICRKTLHC